MSPSHKMAGIRDSMVNVPLGRFDARLHKVRGRPLSSFGLPIELVLVSPSRSVWDRFLVAEKLPVA